MVIVNDVFVKPEPAAIIGFILILNHPGYPRLNDLRR